MVWNFFFGDNSSSQNDKHAICGGLPFRNRPLDDSSQLQSVEIDAKEKIRRSVLCGQDGLWKVPETAPQTILECFENGLSISRDRVVCGIPQRDGSYATKTYTELEEDVLSAGRAFQKLGYEPKVDKFAIFSQNCYQYDAAILGGYYRNLCNVSLYDTLGKDAVSYILNHIEAKCVFVGDEKKLEDILSILDELRFLEVIITFEECSPSKNDKKIKVISWVDFLKSGENMTLVQKKPNAKGHCDDKLYFWHDGQSKGRCFIARKCNNFGARNHHVVSAAAGEFG